jgi:outer membrane protein assembly factor BamB
VLTDDELQGYSPDGDELWARTVPVREMAPDRRAVLYSGDVVAVDDTLYLDTTRVWTVDPETGDRAHTVAGRGIGAFAATSEIVVIADACCPVRGYIEARHVDG